MEKGIREGENPVFGHELARALLQTAFDESGCLGMQPKMGGKLHLKLNMGTRPIANKYREGKMKSTLKRESKARETVKREMIKASSARGPISPRPRNRWRLRTAARRGVAGWDEVVVGALGSRQSRSAWVCFSRSWRLARKVAERQQWRAVL